MKVCPDCAAHYEDHLETCLVDGATLTSKEEPVAVATPNPLVKVVVLLVVLLVLGGVGGFLLMGGSTPESARTPFSVVQPVAEAPPSPSAVVPDTFQLITQPEGAEVFEGDLLVCVSPCELAHPTGASLPRSFRFTLAGHQTESYTLTKGTGSHQVRLVATEAPPPPVAPSPTPVRTAPRPSPVPSRPSQASPMPGPAPVLERTPPPKPAVEPAVPAIKPMSDFKDPFK